MTTSKISTLDGIKLYDQRAKYLQMSSWKDCTSQNYRSLFSFRLSWLCTIEKVLNTMDKQFIYDWRRLYFFFWSDDESSTLHGSDRSCGKRISHRESKRKKSLRWEESGKMLSVESTWTMFQRRLMQFQSWHSSLWQKVRRSETKRTIVYSRTKFEGKDWRREEKSLATKRKSTSDKRSGIPCRYRVVTKNRHVNLGILPCVKTASQKKGCLHGKRCFFRHVKAVEKSSKRQMKGGAKASAVIRSLHSWVEYLWILIREIYSTWRRKIGTRTHRQILQRHLAPNSNSGKKRSIERNYPKVCTSRA